MLMWCVVDGVLLERDGDVEGMVLVPGCGDHREQGLIFHAPLREGREGAPLGPPFAHRLDEPQPRLLGYVLALAPGWQSEPRNRVLHERLVPANELVLGAPVAALRGLDKPPTGRVVLGRKAARSCHGGAW